jgi:hypothetical protein
MDISVVDDDEDDIVGLLPLLHHCVEWLKANVPASEVGRDDVLAGMSLPETSKKILDHPVFDEEPYYTELKSAELGAALCRLTHTANQQLTQGIARMLLIAVDAACKQDASESDT